MALSRKAVAVVATQAIVDTGTYSVPIVITSSITIPADNRSRIFLKSNGGQITNPTIGAGAVTKELILYGCSNTDTILLNAPSNVILNGKIVLKNHTQLFLLWNDLHSKWIEVARNEI